MTQIAYQFCVPMVVTKVGGLAEIVPDGRVGYVCEPTPEGVAGAIERMYEGDTLQRFRENCVEARSCTGWWLPENRGRRSFRENCFFGISFVIQAKRPIFAGPNSYSCILWRHNSSI